MVATPVVVAALAATAGAVYWWRRTPARTREQAEEEPEELPVVTPEKVVQIFTKLCSLMNQHLTSLMRRINANGQNVPQQILAQYLVENFEQQLQELQTQVFSEFGVSEEDLEDAVDYYEDLGPDGPRSPEVVEATNQLRQLYINVGGRVDLDLPEDLTVDKMCTIFEDYMAAVVSAQHAFTEHLHAIKAKGNLTSVTTSDLQEARQAKIQEKVSVVLNKHNLNSLVFQVFYPSSWNYSRFLGGPREV